MLRSFGENLKEEVFQIGEATTFYSTYIQERFLSPIRSPRWLPTPKNRKAKSVRESLEKIIGAMIQRQRQTGGHNVMSKLLEAKDPKTGESLSDKEVYDQVLTLLLASHETTANLLSWTLYLLSQHPDCLQKLVDEQIRIVGSDKLKPEHIQQMDLLTATLRESMRLFPPIPMVSRTALGKDLIHGFDIAKDAVVIYSFYHTQRDERFWQNPNAFRPERFIKDSLEPETPFAFFAFGRGGVRSCIDEEMAMFEARIILSEILRALSFEIDPEYQLQTEVAVSFRPVRGMPLFVSKKF